MLPIHIAYPAYDKSYDNIENFREALDYCGEQWKHSLSARKTEKDVKKKVLYNLSIGIQEDAVYKTASRADSYTVSSCRFRPYDNCHYFMGSFGLPRAYTPSVLHIISTHYKVTLPIV